jgi:hypothetical protein
MSSLILKRASASRPSGEWNEDDFDVLADGAVVGRIFKVSAAPVGCLRIWTVGRLAATRIARPTTAMLQPERPPWLPSRKAGGGLAKCQKKASSVPYGSPQLLNGREIQMRVLAIAAIVTSLAAPAFAEEDPSKAEQYRFQEQKKRESEESERAYKETLKRTSREQPAKKTDSSDPWRNSR